jgi:hypothetical protein
MDSELHGLFLYTLIICAAVIAWDQVISSLGNIIISFILVRSTVLLLAARFLVHSQDFFT